MALTFTPEDGTGVVGANSYVTVAEVRDYLSVVPSAVDLLAENDVQIENLAMFATRVLEQKTKWNGRKQTYADAHVQGLSWPRTCAVDKYRCPVADNIVPPQVKAATIEFMRFVNTQDPTLCQDVTNLKEVDVDVIKIVWQDGIAQTTYPSILNQILEGLGWLEVGSKGFARVIKA